MSLISTGSISLDSTFKWFRASKETSRFSFQPSRSSWRRGDAPQNRKNMWSRRKKTALLELCLENRKHTSPKLTWWVISSDVDYILPLKKAKAEASDGFYSDSSVRFRKPVFSIIKAYLRLWLRIFNNIEFFWIFLRYLKFWSISAAKEWAELHSFPTPNTLSKNFRD